MNLDDILKGNDAFIFMERYVDEAAKTYSPFAGKSEVRPEYQPRSDTPSFELATVIVPKDHVRIFEAGPAEELRRFYMGPEGVVFAVHPETWSSPGVGNLDYLHGLPRGERIEVAPTSSTRTVLTVSPIKNVPDHFIKLHCPRRISRFNRRLRLKNIHNSIEVSRDLAHVHLDRFAYLPETLGFTCGDGENPWGFLVREMAPRPRKTDRFMVPYFALFAGDLKHPEDPPLLVQMIRRLNVEPASFVVDEVMVPVVECWARAVRERGILLESHAQNILLEVDRQFRPCRVVHRDLDVWIDAEVRERAGLGFPFIGTQIGSVMPYPREQYYSLLYDRFIGHELFDYLLKILRSFYAADEAAVRRRVADAFKKSFPDFKRFLPADTTYYFSNELLPGNEFRLVDMKQAPEWR